MQVELIRSLYREFARGSDPSRRCYLLNERVDKTRKEFRNLINKKQIKKFERLCEDYEEINLEETENAFIDGFSFAVQLLSEAYAHK